MATMITVMQLCVMLYVHCLYCSGFKTKNLVAIYHWYNRDTVCIAGKIVCYFESWATYRTGPAKFDVETIDPNLCTHLIYAFLNIDSNAQVTFFDSWNDIDLSEYLLITSLNFNAVSMPQIY
jgi:GH18 family chitinase